MTESESVETVNTTDLQIILNRTVVGQSYTITVHAVNIVGAGVNSSGVCEITTDTPGTDCALATLLQNIQLHIQ